MVFSQQLISLESSPRSLNRLNIVSMEENK